MSMNTTTSIDDLTTFTAAIDRYGAALDDWPAALREPAARYLSHSAQAQQLLDQARILESLLQSLSVEPATTHLRRRIISSVPMDPWQQLTDWFASNLWRPSLAAVASLVLGFLIGVQGWEPDGGDQLLTEELSQLAFFSDFKEVFKEDFEEDFEELAE